MSKDVNDGKFANDAQMKATKRIQEIYRKQRKEKLRKYLKMKEDEERRKLPNDAAVKSTCKRLKMMKKQFIESLTSEMEYIIANQPNAMTSLRVKAIFMIGLQNKLIQQLKKSIRQNSKIQKILTKDYDQAVLRRM
ncbi:unnamed protein product [Schistosoma turkestanicum]|nr:unnamed protein product [Schistosoma turkestanicum]